MFVVGEAYPASSYYQLLMASVMSSMQSLDLKSIVSIVSQYQSDSHAGLQPPLLRKLQLQRIHADLPVLLHHLKHYKSNKAYSETLSQIQKLSNEVAKLLYESDVLMNQWLVQFHETDTVETTKPHVEEIEDEESYASLRKRLLADASSSSKIEDASNDQLNSYHESVHEDLISELSDLTSSLKTSAMTLSSKITADAKLVSETTEHMVKNLSLMHTVGGNLNNYLGAKSGGKISLFFMIKIMVFVFVLFFFMAFIAKFLPKM